MAILRLSHVEIRVPDLELATAYYSEVVGMFETAREGDRVFLKCWDEHQHHSVILQSAPTYGLVRMGWKLQFLEDLDYYQEKLEAVGVQVDRLNPGQAGRVVVLRSVSNCPVATRWNSLMAWTRWGICFH